MGVCFIVLRSIFHCSHEFHFDSVIMYKWMVLSLAFIVQFPLPYNSFGRARALHMFTVVCFWTFDLCLQIKQCNFDICYEHRI
jgi:hypothetical protein